MENDGRNEGWGGNEREVLGYQENRVRHFGMVDFSFHNRTNKKKEMVLCVYCFSAACVKASNNQVSHAKQEAVTWLFFLLTER